MTKPDGDLGPLRNVADLHRVLALLLNLLTLRAGALEYRLVGTAAALAHGVPLPTGDIDILVRERAAVDHFAEALSAHPCLTAPTWLPHSAQYYATFELDGHKVEAGTVEQPTPADTFECIGTGPWQHYAEIPVGPHRVPAVRLELRLGTELVRDRPDRYEPLLSHLRTYGVDAPLLERAMEDRGVAPRLRRHARARLDLPGAAEAR
jgi:hypothetical protein